MTKLFLIRHGETDWNVQRRYQGHTDTNLNSNGQAQANQLVPVLEQLQPFDLIFSSDLKRVIQTATCAGIPEANIIKEPRMREISFGKFEGLTHTEIAEKYPNELDAWGDDREDNVHGGEKMSQVIARVRSFYEYLRDDFHDGERMVCFAHGGSIAIFLAVAMGVNPHKWWQFRVDNTAVTEVNLYDHGTLLKKFNDTRHLV